MNSIGLLPLAAVPATTPKGLQALDWVLLVGYAVSMLLLGWYFGRKQQSTEEYFVGSGNMSSFFIGVSLFATLLSTISYLSMPGEALGKGPVNLAMLLAMPFVFVVVAYFFLPVLMRNRVTSAYELLERKLGVSVRLLGAICFLTLRLFWMSLLIHLAGTAMLQMLGLGEDRLFLVVLVIGAVSVTYTCLGGLRAVVVTDFLQTVLLLGGALLVIVTVTINMGGFGWFPTSWQPEWDTQPIFSWNPGTRITLVSSLVSFFLWYVGTSCGDQTSVQRFMATRDASAARRALATQLLVSAVVAVVLNLVGFSLLGFFRANPQHLGSLTIADNADALFPRFIAYHLPVGVSGLVVAAMFAAAMSSVDSGVNSISAVVMTDFLDRAGLSPETEAGHVRISQLIALVVGVVVVLASSLMQHISGNITAVTGKTVNLLTVPIFCLFVYALFVPFARPVGVWIGTICGTLAALAVAFSGPIVAYLCRRHGYYPTDLNSSWKLEDGQLIATDPISFQWISLVALVVDLGVGISVCWLLRKRDPGEPSS